jgi:hypothetical protein
VAEDTLVAAGAGTARKVAAALDFGDFGSAFNDLPAGACSGVVLGFVSLNMVGHLGGSARRTIGGRRKLGFEVEPVRPKLQGARAAPVDGLANGDESNVCVVGSSVCVAVHLDIDEFAQARNQLGDQWLAESCDPRDAQPENLGSLSHRSRQFGNELANACDQRLVRGDDHNALFMGEGVQELELLVHRSQNVISRPAKSFGQVVGDVEAHGEVSWKRLPVPKIYPAVHRTLEETSGPTAGHQIEQRGSIFFFCWFNIVALLKSCPGPRDKMHYLTK